MDPREICVSKSIGLALQLEGNLPFLFLFFFLHLRAISPSRSPPGAYIRRDDLTEHFSRYECGRLIHGGAYTWRGLFSEFYGISRKVGGKNVHTTIPKGKMGYDQYAVPDAVAVESSVVAFFQHPQKYVYGLSCHSFKFL